MSFSVEKFEDFLTANSLEFKDNGRSVILQTCPECGNSAWKVWFSHEMPESADRLLGKCFKCGRGWSSVSYLLESEIEKKEVLDLHEINRTAGENEGLSLEKLSLSPIKVAQEKEAIATFQLEGFVPMKDALGSYHAKYAISRGVPASLYANIMIDFNGGAVVFPVMESGKCVGYQKRLLAPGDPHRKAHTPPGFEKGKHVLQYPNSGDIAVVEGPFTAISAYCFGFHAVCTFGAGISQQQLEKIEQLATSSEKKVAVGYDLDDAGIKGLYKIVNYMTNRGIPVYRVLPEIGNDLNDSFMVGKGFKAEEIGDEIDTSVPMLGSL